MFQLFGVIVALVGVGIWAIVNASHRAASAKAQASFVPPPQPPYCATCGMPGMWNQQYNLYGCNRCQQWITPGTATAQGQTVGGLPMQPPIQ